MDEFCLDIRKTIVAKNLRTLKQKKAKIIRGLKAKGWQVVELPPATDPPSTATDD
jgi:predicted nuclease with RNAse H fold